MIWWRALAVWLLMALAESLHGALREYFIVPLLGRPATQMLGFCTGSLIILAIAWLLAPWLRAGTRPLQWRVGLLWVILMLGFEAGLGLARGLSWSRLLADYNPAAGGLMLFGMLLLLLAPAITARGEATHSPEKPQRD